MTRILYLPLDERPCNYLFPVRIADLLEDIEVVRPDISHMGKKKKPADIDYLTAFLEQEASSCDVAVVSLDLLLYGGIVPSRIHNYTVDEVKQRLYKLKEIKNKNSHLKIYAYNLIMRVPAYNSSEEEPDYYQEYGRDIFMYSCLTDKIQMNKATEDEKKEYESLNKKIPREVIEDYIQRRKVNESINEMAIQLVKEGIIDFLVIPQDDCSPYGFFTITQRKLSALIRKYELWDQVYIYPGADEVGCTLMARAINKSKGWLPKVYVRYNSEIGYRTIPLYEDRPLCESIKSQISAAGGVIVHDESTADYILFVNAPADKMKESTSANDIYDNSYERMRNIREMIEAMQYYIDQNKPCAVADVAYANGGDGDLVKLLSKKELYYKLYGYAGWNTCGNTLGTVISHSMIAVKGKCLESPKHQRFLFERFLDDWAYQSVLRSKVTNELLPRLGLNYFWLGDQQDKVTCVLKEEFQNILERYFPKYKDYHLTIERIYMPWNRMFEVGIEMGIKG